MKRAMRVRSATAGSGRQMMSDRLMGSGLRSLGTLHLSPCIPSCAGLFKRSPHTLTVRGWCAALLHANLAGEPRVEDTEIDIEPLETVVRATPRMPLAEEWATVMAASGIGHRLALTTDGWAVVVARDDGARATAVLAAYDEENRPRVRHVD